MCELVKMKKALKGDYQGTFGYSNHDNSGSREFESGEHVLFDEK